MDDGRKLTRRTVLAGAAGAGAGWLLGPRSARAAAPAAETLFSEPVGALTPDVPVTVCPNRAFGLAAVRWAAPAHPRVELRTRRRDGTWGRWASAGAAGHEGDGVRADGHAGEGVLTGGPARVLQLRAPQPVQGVVVQFVDELAVGSSDADGPEARVLAAPPHVESGLAAGPGQPAIIARPAWAGSARAPRHGPVYATVKLGFVHHTDGPNDYEPDAVPGMIRSIWAFHVFGRGWWDIGYNFLVDRFGRIWEGRAGGIDLPVLGAQAGDWNPLSTGVAVLGTYDEVRPSRAALTALEHLLAWKLALHGCPARGEIPLRVPRPEVSYTRFRAGEHIHLPRIAGHREADATSCPGDALESRLPELRSAAARLAGVPARLSMSIVALADLAVPGLSLTVGGRLDRLTGDPIAGASVTVQRVVDRDGRVEPLTTVTTAADGRWRASLTPGHGLRSGDQLLRAVHAGSPAAVSEVIDLGDVAG